jgi:hypothetical protein
MVNNDKILGNVPLHIPDPLSTTRAAISSSSAMVLSFVYLSLRSREGCLEIAWFHKSDFVQIVRGLFRCRSDVVERQKPNSTKMVTNFYLDDPDDSHFLFSGLPGLLVNRQ